MRFPYIRKLVVKEIKFLYSLTINKIKNWTLNSIWKELSINQKDTKSWSVSLTIMCKIVQEMSKTSWVLISRISFLLRDPAGRRCYTKKLMLFCFIQNQERQAHLKRKYLIWYWWGGLYCSLSLHWRWSEGWFDPENYYFI